MHYSISFKVKGKDRTKIVADLWHAIGALLLKAGATDIKLNIVPQPYPENQE